ncbi:MAG: glycosyltransferase family 4 protein [Candidatus Bathyarchaeia archaeon]
MKILQICPDSYAEYGGVSTHVRNIAERLAKRHDVTVYATGRSPKYPRYEFKNGVKVERFKCYAPSDSYFFSLEMLLRLRKVEFDVVHGHGYHALPLHYATVAKCSKLVATTHFHGFGHTPFRNCLIKLFKPIGKNTLKKADKVIAVSEFEKSLLTKYFRLKHEKVVVIPNGVNFEEFKGLRRKNQDYKVILYVGGLLSFKGVHYLIDVLPKLADDVILEIVGNGPLKPFLEKRARELKVYDRVRFYGYIPRKELLQKFVDADLFVLLSTYEAYSIVVAEALTAGTPCIVTNTSALTEWVDDETCFGLDLPLDLNKLAQLISYVLNNGVDRRSMRKWIGTKILDWNEVVDMLEKIYVE